MKKLTFIYRLALCMLPILFCACSDDEDFDEKYGTGSPLAENIIHLPGYEYSYNENGLVTQIRHSRIVSGPNGKPTQEWEVLADITYPKDDRAVMIYHDGCGPFTYVFAFGANHFANRIIETDYEGESFIHKFDYDINGHLIHYKLPEEELKLEWTNGNLTKVIDDPSSYSAYTILTYNSRTDFAAVKMDPFLLDVPMGPFLSSLNSWFSVGLDCALYAGFLGKPCKNLPETLTSYDNYNEKPQKSHFEYYNNRWSLVVDYN